MRAIREAALLHGEFVLRSGLRSATYWDKYRFESDRRLLAPVADALAQILPPAFDRLAGLELGGIPLVAALALRTGRPCLFVRTEAKSYGTRNLVEGGFRPGDAAVVVEDVVTSGGQIAMSVGQMRELGLRVERAVCVIDREQGGREALAAIGCSLASVFAFSELEAAT